MRKLTLILILTSNLTFGQTAEQKALTFLAKNIHGQELKNSYSAFVVKDDSTKIWYYPFVLDTKTKLILENGIHSSHDKFDKVVHSFKDIFVTTKKATNSADKNLVVPFEIFTKYGLSFLYTVTFEGNEPTKLIRTIN
jgi:hypothetical protein